MIANWTGFQVKYQVKQNARSEAEWLRVVDPVLSRWIRSLSHWAMKKSEQDLRASCADPRIRSVIARMQEAGASGTDVSARERGDRLLSSTRHQVPFPRAGGAASVRSMTSTRSISTRCTPSSSYTVISRPFTEHATSSGCWTANDRPPASRIRNGRNGWADTI